MPSRAPLTRETQLSKKLSWLLRHGAEKEGLELNAAGYASVSAVLANQKIRSQKMTFAELQAIVKDNDKQRFALSLREGCEDETSADPKDWMIRANQGHSVKVESEGLLEAIGEDDEVVKGNGVVVHGTTHAAWTRIVETGGLKVMGRNHVHFASGLPATFKPIDSADGPPADQAGAPVISGMRVSSTVLLYLNVEKAMAAGIKFWRSSNGVILTEGNTDGMVPMAFFKRVEDRTGEGLLVEDGKVVKEAPAGWATGGGKGKGRGGRG